MADTQATQPHTVSRARPVLKWAGGKQQLVPKLLEMVPESFGKYIEPFVGGGALFFAVQPSVGIIGDSNPELINLYKVIAADVENLIHALGTMQVGEDEFYRIRAVQPEELDEVERAARTIYLNRTCFNGLYRVNRKGQFNTPYGHYRNPRILDEDNLRAAAWTLRNTLIVHADYKDLLRDHAAPGDFVFLDPPYVPVSEYSDFKRYTKEQFYEEDHRDLATEVERLHELGCFVVLTNSNHPFVHELYGRYEIAIHETKRLINKHAGKRTGQDTIVVIRPEE